MVAGSEELFNRRRCLSWGGHYARWLGMRPTFVRTHRFVGWLESPADRVGPEVSPDGVGDYTKDRPENGFCIPPWPRGGGEARNQTPYSSNPFPPAQGRGGWVEESGGCFPVGPRERV